MPTRQRNLVQVPGRNGKLDMALPEQSDSWSHRAITISCDAPDRNFESWNTLISEIANAVQDGYLPVVPDFDLEHYYKGYVKMAPSKDYREGSDIVFTIDAEPFRYKKNVTKVNVASTAAGKDVILSNEKKHVNPKLVTSAQITVTIGDWVKVFAAGTYPRMGYIIPAGDTTVNVKGASNVLFEYQEGGM